MAPGEGFVGSLKEMARRPQNVISISNTSETLHPIRNIYEKLRAVAYRPLTKKPEEEEGNLGTARR